MLSGYRRRLMLLGGSLAVAAIIAAAATPRIRWRLHILALHTAGRIPDIEFKQLVAYLLPSSDQWLEPLIETRNPYAVVRNHRTTTADIAAGSRKFRQQCGVCHAPDGTGGPGGPRLVNHKYRNGESDWAVYRTVRYGIPNTAMTPRNISDEETWQVVGYLRSLGTAGANDSSTTERRDLTVTEQELVAIREPADEWLTYSGSYTSSRHSLLTQITPANVHQLQMRWIHQIDGEPSVLQVTPIVRKNVMFVTAPRARVLALDATTGRRLWTYEHKVSDDALGSEFGPMIANRGVAILNDKVYLSSMDAKLIALSAATGKVQWEAVVSDNPQRYYISSAPLACRDLVITGVGTRGGGQGFIAAFDANTGKERWRFVAIPGPGQRGHESWAGDSWREGGAPTWLTGSYDPELDLLIWGVGNPKPDYDADARKGDNLYSNSVVALRRSTGELAWYFQFTPADDHDWDANQIPVLADFESPKGIQKRVLWANRNGFYYVLDRVSGRFINAVPYVHQTWTKGLDAAGRPVPSSAVRSREGAMIFPGNMGATNWWSPSFDPVRNLMFVPTLEQGMVYFSSAASVPKAQDTRFYTAVRALDGATGKLVWEHRHEPRLTENKTGGLLSTATGLVFGGDRNTFFALDSKTGKQLWSMEAGASVMAAPISYALNGEQFIAVAAGRDLLAFAVPRRPAL